MTDQTREQRAAEPDARAHNARIAIPPRTEPSRYGRRGPEARALVEDFDELDLAEMLVAEKNARAAEEAGRRALAQRQEMAAERYAWQERGDRAERERDQARATNQRLNLRAQRLESELAAYRRAVAQWESSERGTYVPLRTIAAIAKAAGRDIENPRWLLHYQRVEQAETANDRLRSLRAEVLGQFQTLRHEHDPTGEPTHWQCRVRPYEYEKWREAAAGKTRAASGAEEPS
jgi:hypothetical protein